MNNIVKINSDAVADISAEAEEKSVAELRELIMASGARMNAKRLAARSKLGRALAPLWTGFVGEQTLFSHELVRKELETLAEMFASETAKPIKLEIARCINDTLRAQMQIDEVSLKLAEISGEVSSKKRKRQDISQITVDTQVAYIAAMPEPAAPEPQLPEAST
jgi:hypothetical protein